MKSTTSAYVTIAIFIFTLFFLFFKVVQRKKKLGEVKRNIGTKSQIYIFVFSLLSVLVYSYITYDSLLREEIPYGVHMALWFLFLMLIIFLNIHWGIKNGQIREKGVNFGSHILEWENINYFIQLSGKTFKIVTTDKRELKWVTKENKSNTLKDSFKKNQIEEKEENTGKI